MSDPQKDAFNARLKRIQSAGSGRPVPTVTGLSRGRQERRKRRIPRKTIVLAVVLFLGLKVFLILRQGEADYDAAVAASRDEGGAKAVAAWVFTADPASVYLSRALRPHVAGRLGWPE